MNTNEYKKQCEWLAKFYAEAAETGRAMQVLACGGWVDYDGGPYVQSIPDEWRLKPDPDKIWLVWHPSSTVPQVFYAKGAAEGYAPAVNGTIQEITRPEPQ